MLNDGRARSVSRIVGLGAVLSGIALGQESAAVGWDPRTHCYSAGWDYVEVCLALTLCYGHWKGLCWFLRTRGQRSNVRLIWPTAMLVLSAICYAASGIGSDAMVALALVSCPVLIPAALAAQFLGLAGWGAFTVASAFVWLESYALVRVADWQQELKGSPLLRIT